MPIFGKLNFMLVKNDIDVKILPDCYNLVDLFRKNLLYLDIAYLAPTPRI